MMRVGLLFVLFATLVGNAEARIVHMWGCKELQEQADVVAVIEPLGTEETADLFDKKQNKRDNLNYTGLNTTFRVHAVFKGSVPPDTPLVVLHFKYSRQAIINNGALFIHFTAGTYKRHDRLAGNIEDGMASLENPTWLAFLKQRKDGRYEPATGFYDARESFRELFRQEQVENYNVRKK